MTVESNWWQHFFEGLAVKLWVAALSPEHTNCEADTLTRLLCAATGAELLDVPCWKRAGYRWRWLSAVIVSLAWTCRASSSSMHGRMTPRRSRELGTPRDARLALARPL